MGGTPRAIGSSFDRRRPGAAWRASLRRLRAAPVDAAGDLHNPHIRLSADGFADEGLPGANPALFDPVEAGVELGCKPSEDERGVALRNAVVFRKRGAGGRRRRHLASPCGGLRVAVVGYCFRAAAAFSPMRGSGFPAVSYYGADDLSWTGRAHP